MIAPHVGPHMRGEVIGGPLWVINIRAFPDGAKPGITSRATPMPTSMGRPAQIRRTASALAASMSMPARVCVSSAKPSTSSST